MLRILRKNAQSPFFLAIVIIIAIVFVFWGVGTKSGSDGNKVAIVDGQEISVVEYNRAYERLVDNLTKQLGGQIPDGLLDKLGLKQQAVNELVQRVLIEQGAANLGIRISDFDVQRVIESNPAFQKNGSFDLPTYKETLERNNLSTNSFEESTRNSLLIERTVGDIGAFASTSDQEVSQWFDFLNLELKLSYKLFTKEDYLAAVKVDDKDLQAWYETRKETYRPSPQYKFEFISYPYSRELSQIEVSPEEQRAYYTEHQAEFEKKEERQVRHILFRVQPTDSDDVRAGQKKKAEEVLAEVKRQGKFAELANEYTEDPAGKGKGGELGFIVRGQMVPAFENAAFSLNEGEVSQVIETSFGYHIIQVEKIKPAETSPFEAVQATIARILSAQKAKTIAFKKVSEAYEGIMRAGSLAKFSTDSHQNLKTTDFISMDKLPKEEPLFQDNAFTQAAFSLGKGQLSSILETPKGYAIIFVEDIRKLDIPSFATVQEQVKKDYSREKSGELAKAAAETNLQSLRDKQTWQQGLQAEETGFLGRGDATNNVPPALIQDAFLQVGQSAVPAQILTIGDAYGVFRIVGVRRGEKQLPDLTAETLQQTLLKTKQDELLNGWIQQLQKTGDIWINPEVLK